MDLVFVFGAEGLVSLTISCKNCQVDGSFPLDTWITIDCFEMTSERPSSFVNEAATCSDYKSLNMFKVAFPRHHAGKFTES